MAFTEHSVAPCSLLNDERAREESFSLQGMGTRHKNIDQLKATYIFATGKQLKVRSGGPRTGFRYIEGDLKQLAQEVDAACRAQNLE